MVLRIGLRGLLLFLAACGGGERFDRPLVSSGLEDRTGAGLGPAEGGLPPGVRLEDGITEDEAVAFALWNNAAFQEALAELGLRRADVLLAGQIPNPVLSLLFPLGDKRLEFWAKLPIEVLWLRPARVAAAEFDAERAAQLLVQGGLDLVRDVRSAYADAAFAEARQSAAERLAVLRGEALGLVDARLRAGDASEAEAATARADAVRAGLEHDRAVRDLAAFRPRLEALLGIRGGPARDFIPGASVEKEAEGEPALVELALRARPDLQAARFGVDGAAERGSLTDIEFLTLTAALDANHPRGEGLELGPGVDVAIPLFNQNQGNRARARAEVVRASQHYVAVRDRIVLDVRISFAGWRKARETREAVDTKLLPALRQAVEAAGRAHEAGETSRAPVIEAAARVVEAELRRAEAEAERRRAWADLERSVGRRIP